VFVMARRRKALGNNFIANPLTLLMHKDIDTGFKVKRIEIVRHNSPLTAIAPLPGANLAGGWVSPGVGRACPLRSHPLSQIL